MSGDLIIALEEVAITGADDLIRSLTGDKIGRTITIDVVRLGKRRRFSLIPEERRRS